MIIFWTNFDTLGTYTVIFETNEVILGTIMVIFETTTASGIFRKSLRLNGLVK